MRGTARPAREPAKPKLAGVVFSPGGPVESDGVYRRHRFDGVDLAGVDADTVEVEACRFDRVDWSGAQLRQGMFSDTVFDHCDLANLTAGDSSLLTTAFAGCRLTGASWTSGVLREVLFEDCVLDLAAFRFTRFKPTVMFRGCQLRGVNFQNADLSGARFQGCDLTGAQFSNARMTGTRFEDCAISELVGVTSFDGAIIRGSDAIGLAHTLAAALGITIEH